MDEEADMSRPLQSYTLLLVLAVAATAAPTVHYGSLGTFSGPGDLDLSGDFKYAVDVGGGGGTVSGLAFTNDTVAGVTVTAENLASPWSTKPEFGATADDNTLEGIMHGIRWTNATNGAPVSVLVDLDVTAGNTYELQLLWTENYWSGPNRTFDVSIEGALAVDELDIRVVTGQSGQPSTLGAVYTHTLVAPDSQLNITLDPGSGSDPNPIINAFTLEDVTPEDEPGALIPEPAGFSLLGLALLALRKSRR
jgi:hypothetical protein